MSAPGAGEASPNGKDNASRARPETTTCGDRARPESAPATAGVNATPDEGSQDGGLACASTSVATPGATPAETPTQDADTANAEAEGCGSQPTITPVRFSELGLPGPVMAAIDDLGFEACTPIQGEVLPYSLSDYDVTGQAQTGTGKTAAFLITILTRQLEYPVPAPLPPGAARSLILAPTRELAQQIEADARELAAHTDTRVVSLVGGIDYQRQRERLKDGPVDILVATPGRLIDFCNQGVANLRTVEVLVIDEADRMLDMGFIPDVRRIVYQTPRKRTRQTMFFSATFNDDVMNLAAQWTLDPVHVAISPDSVAVETVEQHFWALSRERKRSALLDFVRRQQPDHTLVFVNRRDQARRLVSYLQGKGVHCEGLAGDIPQRKRLATLHRFKDGKTNLVVATDVAGRGIHVEGISHVINYDLPEDAEDYVHRIGRTGRAGASGIAISFVSEDDAFDLPAIETLLGQPIRCTQPDL